MSSVTISGLTKTFGAKRVLDGVDLRVEEGTFVTLLGSSGCGKTTTLRCIAGLESPDSGQIHVGKKAVFGAGINLPARSRSLGMVFQSYALWPNMTVADNVAFGLAVRGMRSADRRKRVSSILETVGLAELRDRYPYELSGGQQQRVGLARALVYEPKVVLLDEPLSNLDATLRDQLRLEIRRIQKEAGTTAIYVTHDTREALSMSDSICLMRNGRILHQATPEQLWHSPGSRYAASFLDVGALVQGRLTDIVASCGRVQVGEAVVSAQLADGTAWRAGEQCSVLIRNPAITLSEPARSYRDGPAANGMAGQVLVTATVGETRETELMISGQRVRISTPAASREQPVPGQPAWLVFPAADALVLKDC